MACRLERGDSDHPQQAPHTFATNDSHPASLLVLVLDFGIPAHTCTFGNGGSARV
jgi:hypothetical protein